MQIQANIITGILRLEFPGSQLKPKRAEILSTLIQ